MKTVSRYEPTVASICEARDWGVLRDYLSDEEASLAPADLAILLAGSEPDHRDGMSLSWLKTFLADAGYDTREIDRIYVEDYQGRVGSRMDYYPPAVSLREVCLSDAYDQIRRTCNVFHSDERIQQALLHADMAYRGDRSGILTPELPGILAQTARTQLVREYDRARRDVLRRVLQTTVFRGVTIQREATHRNQPDAWLGKAASVRRLFAPNLLRPGVPWKASSFREPYADQPYSGMKSYNTATMPLTLASLLVLRGTQTFTAPDLIVMDPEIFEPPLWPGNILEPSA